MSQSTPVCLLFCSKCKAKSRQSNPRHHYDRDCVRDYLDVVVVGPVPGGVFCVCKRCGHAYTSKSAAARRALRYKQQREQSQ